MTEVLCSPQSRFGNVTLHNSGKSSLQEKLTNSVHFLESLSCGEVKNRKLILGRTLINLTSRVIIGVGAIDATIDYFSGYKTFRNIYKEKGRTKAYMWAVKNAVPTVMKGALSIAAFPAYVFVKSASFTEKRLRSAFESKDQTTQYMAVAGAAAGLLTELLIGRILPHEWVSHGYTTLLTNRNVHVLESIKQGVFMWGIRMAALQGESFYVQEAARFAGYSSEEASRFRKTYYNSAMAIVSAKVLLDRYGETLKSIASYGLACTAGLVQTYEAYAAPPLQETEPLHIEGDLPRLEPTELNISLEHNPELKAELLGVRAVIERLQKELLPHADFVSRETFQHLGSMNEAISAAVLDDALTFEEYERIIQEYQYLPGGLEHIVYSHFERPEIETGLFRNTWLIEGKAVDDVTINGKSWNLVNHLFSIWDKDLGIQQNDQIVQQTKDVLTIGINHWGAGYDEHFAQFKGMSLTELLGENDPDNFENLILMETWLREQASSGSIEWTLFKWDELLKNLDSEKALYIVFHSANQTESVINPFIDDFSKSILQETGGVDITQEEARTMARQFLYTLSHEIVRNKYIEMTQLAGGEQVDESVDFSALKQHAIFLKDSIEFETVTEVPDIEQSVRYFNVHTFLNHAKRELGVSQGQALELVEKVGFTSELQREISPDEQRHYLELLLSGLQYLQNLHTDWQAGWQIVALEKLSSHSYSLQEFSISLQDIVSKYTILATLENALKEQEVYDAQLSFSDAQNWAQYANIDTTMPITIALNINDVLYAPQLTILQGIPKRFVINLSPVEIYTPDKKMRIDPFPIVTGITIASILTWLQFRRRKILERNNSSR